MKKIISLFIAFIILVTLQIGFTEHNPIITEARTHLNKPYVFAAAGPDSFDCSGFTSYLVKKIYNIELPHSAYEQGYDDTYEKIESIDALKPGDLVYFNTITTDDDKCDHVGLYIGNKKFIHASSKAQKVVISSLKEEYYESCFSWGRRISK